MTTASVRSGIAKAVVAGGLIGIPALALPALAQAAPTETVCVAGQTVVCYVVSTSAMSQVTAGAPAYSTDDSSGADTESSGGGGGAGGG